MTLIKNIMLATITSLLISSCRFDISPWENDVNCDTLNLEANLEWLNLIEKRYKDKTDFSVAVIGDPQQYPGDLELTIKKINKINKVDFVLLLGDLTETGVEKEYEWTCKAVSHTSKPILSVIGNHDALAYGRVIWLDTIGPFDYSFTYKNTKFIAYNDNKYEFENVPDKEWIANEALISSDETRLHTIGMSHIEPWDVEPTLTDELKLMGFDQMLHAHNHKFAYWQKSSVELPHFITADTRDVKFGIMNITPDSISIEQCDPECVPILPVNR
ncbi:metallophosphoesterase [Psychrosphaera sp. F3M07]|uniref:metallophosphoesterase family protein n=1 Tax=Psychrosphaera sp. F3M07 TaxID=2841560 RepID=UPI001C08D76D|nr:metallophosphoesterase [Psychrosphaera sp. F3M07]MBU2916705.1 metallophosphoesterase [Psychrosphaera sp. F3M07]